MSDPHPALMFLAAAGVSLLAKLPLGSVSILTIQRAMTLGFGRAFLPTLGAMAGDAVFGVLAALGSGYVSGSILGGGNWLRLTTGIVLLFIGARLLMQKETGDGLHDRESFGLGQLAVLKFTLVITNPLTLGFYIAAFAGLGLESPAVLAAESFVLAGGILAGALVWFVSVCALAGRFNRRIHEKTLKLIRKGVGIIILFLGAVSFIAGMVKM